MCLYSMDRPPPPAAKPSVPIAVRLAAARRGGADTALVFDGSHHYATVLRGGHLVPEFYIRVTDLTAKGGDMYSDDIYLGCEINFSFLSDYYLYFR